MHQFGSLRRHKWLRISVSLSVCVAISGAVLSLAGCTGALYGGTAGAYAAAGSVSYCNSGYGGCSGGSGEFLLFAVVVGATIGAVVEIVKRMCGGR